MAEYSSRSGRRVSEYRKQHYQKGISLLQGGPLVGSAIEVLDRDTTNVTQIKHIRGYLTIGPSNSTVSGAPSVCRGYIALIRYPITETLGASDINFDASWLLHPVPFAIVQYPQAIEYDFKAITLGEREQLYFIAVPDYANVTFTGELSLIWDERKTPV